MIPGDHQWKLGKYRKKGIGWEADNLVESYNWWPEINSESLRLTEQVVEKIKQVISEMKWLKSTLTHIIDQRYKGDDDD